MNIDLLLDKSWTQKSEIWFDYFKKRDETLVATVPFLEFRDFYRQSIHYPMFILQLLRENGERELIFIETECWKNKRIANCTAHLTPVTNYKTYKENAPECMTVEYYTDFCKSYEGLSKDAEEALVLMKATHNGKLLSSYEAKRLVGMLNCFYQNCLEHSELEKVLDLFNKGVKPYYDFGFSDAIEKAIAFNKEYSK